MAQGSIVGNLRSEFQNSCVFRLWVVHPCRYNSLYLCLCPYSCFYPVITWSLIQGQKHQLGRFSTSIWQWLICLHDVYCALSNSIIVLSNINALAQTEYILYTSPEQSEFDLIFYYLFYFHTIMRSFRMFKKFLKKNLSFFLHTFTPWKAKWNDLFYFMHTCPILVLCVHRGKNSSVNLIYPSQKWPILHHWSGGNKRPLVHIYVKNIFIYHHILLISNLCQNHLGIHKSQADTFME